MEKPMIACPALCSFGGIFGLCKLWNYYNWPFWTCVVASSVLVIFIAWLFNSRCIGKEPNE
jgi:hypothetical protein